MRTPTAGRYVGSSVTRVEDDRLLVGKGRYIADIDLPYLLHAAFLRSPEPHAVISSIDTDAARRLPGVRAVITGEEMKRLTNPLVNVGMLDGLPGEAADIRIPAFANVFAACSDVTRATRTASPAKKLPTS